MRMWNVSPRILCRQHLLGEHYELHKLVGSIRRGYSITGYVKKGLVNTRLIKKRHDALATEMRRRNMNHTSPLRYTDKLKMGRVNVSASLRELAKRCPECRALQRRNNHA